MKNKNKARKSKRILLVIPLVLILVISIIGAIGWSMIQKEHNEILSLNFANIDFDKLADGKYEGYFEGGMYKWRENIIEVIVDSGEIISVRVLKHSEGSSEAFTSELFNRVMTVRSFDVDAISGATLTSKAYLKGFEDALLKAQK